MNRFSNRDDDNFTTVTGLDGKPVQILRDRGRVRVSMQMRDAAMAKSGTGSVRGEVAGDLCTINGSEGRLRMVNGALQCVPLKSQDARPQFTDGRTTDPTALNRPGFRVPVVNDRRAVHDAYDADAAYLRNRYKCGDGERLCEDCGGEGKIDGERCDTCNGNGVMPEVEDEREEGKSLFGSGNGHGRSDDSDSRTLDQHRQMMDQLYRERDAELSQMWRMK
jgi:hypothetical protein